MNSNDIDHRLKNIISDRLSHNFENQVTEAIQVKSEIDSVDSNKAYLLVKKRLRKKNRATLIINNLSRIAAVLFLPLMITSGILFYRQANIKIDQQFAMQEITSPLGVRTKVVLPDGSNVWLNAESTIKFKVPFDKSSRNVSLTGEAFFEVKKNPNAPFIVKSGIVNVSVLGTRFNCKAFENENNIEIVLAEGKVSLNTNNGKAVENVVMKPGERAVFDKSLNTITVSNEKIDKYIAWQSGKLVFDETPMPEVATQISRWYGVDVVINDPKINNYRITTTFENESLHEMLELLRLSSPIDIKYIAATVDNANIVKSKSKVIFSKKSKR